jgi:hypothetical protein
MKKYLSKPKVRKPHHHYHHGLQQKRVHTSHANPLPKINSKRANAIVVFVAIIFGLLGIGITYFGAGGNVVWLFVGTLAGLIFGYAFGVQIVKGLSKSDRK